MVSPSNKLSILSLQYYSSPDEAGGAWGLTYEVNKRLAAKGHKVILLTCKPDESFPDHEVIDDIQYFRIPARRRKKFFRLYLSLRQKVNSILDRESIQLVHIHNPLIGFLAILNPRLRPIPKVYHFHSSWYDEEKINREAVFDSEDERGLLFRIKLACVLFSIRIMEGFCYYSSRGILFLSEYSKRRFLDYYSRKMPRLRVIPGGVDVERFRPPLENGEVVELRGRLGWPADIPVLLTVRRLAARMGLENLIRAAALIAKKEPHLDFLLLIVGKGDLALKLSALIDTHKVEHRVRLTGYVDSNQLPFYYRAASLFILPSVSIEGFGLSTVEALASGVPVLGTPVGGTVEILHAIDDKLLFSKTDPKVMAAHIEGFLKNPAPYQALRNRCRQEAISRYSWDKVVDRIEEEFQLVAGQGTRAQNENPIEGAGIRYKKVWGRRKNI